MSATREQIERLVLGGMPTCALQHRGLCLVIAPGWTMWEDLAELERILPSYRMPTGKRREDRGSWDIPLAVVAVNDAALVYPGRVHHIISAEHQVPGPYRLARCAGVVSGMGQTPENMTTHGPQPWEGTDFAWQFTIGGGTSTLFALMVTTCLGFDKLVIAGAPMDAGGHVFSPPGVHNNYYGGASMQRNEWEPFINGFGGMVRSFSGNTAAWLGRPTEEWLNG